MNRRPNNDGGRGTSLANLTYIYLSNKQFWQLQKETHPDDGLFQLAKAGIFLQIYQPIVTWPQSSFMSVI